MSYTMETKNYTENEERLEGRAAAQGKRLLVCAMLSVFDLHCDLSANSAITVVAGSPHEPIVRAIAMDLERRGYIVYVTVSSADEEHIIRSENRVDIKALWLDLTAASAVRISLTWERKQLILYARLPPRRPKPILHCKSFAP